MTPQVPRLDTVDEVLALYERFGADPYDEEISQLDHALQTAALAVAEGASDELVAAALLHDVGHLLHLAEGGRPVPAPHNGGFDLHHERVGARALAGVFPPAVTGPIALHVEAKRYRCAVDSGYQASLSAGSRRSLAVQGGPLDAHGVRTFERRPGTRDALRLRAWDDAGKVEGLEVASLVEYRDLLQRVARAH